MSQTIYSGSLTLRELYERIGQTGWSLKKVKYDKGEDHFLASAKDPFGREIEKTGPNEEQAVKNLLIAIERKKHARTAAMEHIGMWKADWTDQLRPIAEAYAKAPVYDPKAAAAYKALADDSVRRAEQLGKQLDIQVTNNPEPYPHAKAMADDIHKRRRFEVSRANSDHPIWTPEQNVAFRTVHDVLGHAVSGGDFGWEGENRACAAHFPMLSEEAQKALFSECIAQTAYAIYYRKFGPQKVALFPEFYEPVQRQEGVRKGYPGIHPSQTTAPVEMPAIKPSTPEPGLPANNIAPHEQEAAGMQPVYDYYPDTGIHLGATSPDQEFDPTLRDPNEGWNPGIAPLEPNAYLHHGDPLEFESAQQNASLIDTEWAYLKTGDGKPDYERMKQAIINAFRVVILSPRKDLRWNAIQYQDLNHIPPGVDDPSVYYDSLENKRQAWNVKEFGESGRWKHKPWFKLIPELEMFMYQRNPEAGWPAAKEAAKRELFDWEEEEQERIMDADRDLPPEEQMPAYQIQYEANKAVAKRIEAVTKARQGKLDYEAAAKKPNQEDTLFPLEPQVDVPKAESYGGFPNGQVKALAQISHFADLLLKAALEDVHEHDGSGHHFRSAVLQLQIPLVGPKVASFAWLILQPMTSQLATIDAHMMDVLGFKGRGKQKTISTRDYFKLERELQAGRDAAGYSGMPLGQFQWAMWDAKRTGLGSHQDHSALRALDPTPHEAIDWQAKENAMTGDAAWGPRGPDWWQATEPIRKQVGEEWDKEVTTPQNEVPFVKTAATPLRTPWLIHPQSGERLVGLPGQTLMDHAVSQLHLSTPEIWERVQEAGKT